jgi:hypothetical protein
MMNWQYFYKVYGRATPDIPPRALGRTDKDGPRYNAEMLSRESEWIRSEFLERYYILGTNEDDYVEISEERAIEIIEEWVSSGRLPRWPDEPVRPGQ